MVNNADILPILSATVVPIFDYVPGLFSQRSIHNVRDSHAIVERVFYPIARIYVRLFMHFVSNPEFNKYRAMR